MFLVILMLMVSIEKGLRILIITSIDSNPVNGSS